MRTRNKFKNHTSYGYKLNKMNSDTYSIRRNVIDVLYEIKRRGYDIPRIEVRIVSEGDDNVGGYAYLKANIVHISEECAKMKNKDILTHLVLHEVVHAVTGFRHDDNCVLMNPCIPTDVDINKTWEAFAKYVA